MAKHQKYMEAMHRRLLQMLKSNYLCQYETKLVSFTELRDPGWLFFTKHAGFEVQLSYQHITKDATGEVVAASPIFERWFFLQNKRWGAWTSAEGLVPVVRSWIAEINTGKLDA